MNTDLSFLDQDAPIAARELIGWQFFVAEIDGSLTGGTIIETEAYSQRDAASHSYRGKTKRNEIMFGESGVLYVYFTYGMHWCLNIVTGSIGDGQAVLIRALQPSSGIQNMRGRRNNRPDTELTDGPAKLCQALDVTGADNGSILNNGNFLLKPPKNLDTKIKIIATPRIGIKNDTGRLWRFISAEQL